MIVTGNSKVTSAGVTARIFLLASTFAGLLAFMSHEADARPTFRGGAGSNGFQRPSGASGQRPAFNHGQRPSGGTVRSGNVQGNGAALANGNRAGNSAYEGNRAGKTSVAGNGNGNVTNANSGVVGSGNGNKAVNNGHVGNTGVVNTGNVAVGNDVDVNVGNGGWNGGYAYPGAAYATGVAVGATTTAVAATAAVGAYYSTLPAGCSPYSAYYYACGGTWYQARYQGNSVTYVVVSDPTKR